MPADLTIPALVVASLPELASHGRQQWNEQGRGQSLR
jgi:hypothetical protein